MSLECEPSYFEMWLVWGTKYCFFLPWQDEALQDVLERLRGRFKATASMLGLLQDYFPKDPEGFRGGEGLTF